MFEKEAEEYIKKNNLEWELECHRTSPIGEVEQAFQKGAEFGYNKAKEELQQKIDSLQGYLDHDIEYDIEQKNKELEAYNEKLLNSDIEKHNKIVELQAQIEKMKCCQNCKHSDIGCQGHTICGNGHFFDCLSNNNFFNHQTSDVDYWEIKEK